MNNSETENIVITIILITDNIFILRHIMNEIPETKKSKFSAMVNPNAKRLFQDLYNPIYFSENYSNIVYCLIYITLI